MLLSWPRTEKILLFSHRSPFPEPVPAQELFPLLILSLVDSSLILKTLLFLWVHRSLRKGTEQGQ